MTRNPDVPAPIGARLDHLAWSPFHTRVTIALGVGWLLDAFEVGIIGNVLGVLKRLWAITDVQASALVSVWLVGILVGALFFGYLADRFGRRKLFLVTLLLYGSSTVISALAPGYAFFLAFRFLTAIGVGAECSAINAAIGELVPARVRGRATALVMNFWPLGTILAASASLLLLDWLPASVGWRLAFGFGAIAALFTVWARKNLPESPRWLLARGRRAEAEAALRQIERHGSSWDVRPATRKAIIPAGNGFLHQVLELARRHPGRLALGTALDAAADTGYYGLSAFLPLIVLPRVHVAAAHAPSFFLMGGAGALAGGLAVAVLLDSVGRKRTVTASYLLAAVAMLAMGWATHIGSASGVLAAFVVVNCFATMSWVSAYPTFSEIFPTAYRSTGIGFCIGVGHLLAGVAPLVLVAVAQRVSVVAAFSLLAASFALGALAMVPWILFGPEGRGLALERLAAAAIAGGATRVRRHPPVPRAGAFLGSAHRAQGSADVRLHRGESRHRSSRP